MSAPDVPSWQYRSDSDRHWHFNLSERVYAKEYAICKSVLCSKMEATPTFDSKPEEMNHFGDLKKTLKSSQGVKGLQILSFECESCPLVQVFLCLYSVTEPHFAMFIPRGDLTDLHIFPVFGDKSNKYTR